MSLASRLKEHRFQDFFDLHWNRFLRENSTVIKTDSFEDPDTNLNFELYERMFYEQGFDIGSSRKDALYTTLTYVGGLLDRMRHIAYLDSSQELSFADLIPGHMHVNHPELADKVLTLLQGVKELDPNEPGLHFKAVAGVGGNAVNNKILQRDKLEERIHSHNFLARFSGNNPQEIDVTDVAGSAYNSISGIINYAATVNHPSYRMTEANDALFDRALQAGLFDRIGDSFRFQEIGNIVLDPCCVAMFSGTSFTELSWFEAFRKHYELPVNHPKVFVDGSNMSMILSKFLNPRREGSEYHKMFLVRDKPINGKRYSPNLPAMQYSYQELFDGKVFDSLGRGGFGSRDYGAYLVIKNNGVPGQAPEEAEHELIVLDNALRTKKSVVWYTVATTHSQTGPLIYASPECRFTYDFLQDYLLVPPELEGAFHPMCEQEQFGDSYSYKIGFQVQDDVRLHNQWGKRNVKLKKGAKLILHRSYRYGENDIDRITDRARMQVFGTIRDGDIALYKQS